MFSYPVIALVGMHTEAETPFRYLLESGERIVGLVTLQPEQAAKVSGALDFGPLASRFGVPVLRTANVNAPEVEAWLKGLQPDLLLVIGWTQLLKDHLLRLPKLATLGFHASLLPRYRGRAPVNWAIIHGETESGNTMMVLEAGADEGDIVAQRTIPIGFHDTCGTIYSQVGLTEVDMLAEVLPLIRAGQLPRRKQDGTHATVMPKRRPEDGIIDWSKSGRSLHDWVRGQTHPYPGAFSFLSGPEGIRKVWIWRAEPVPLGPDAPPHASPGQVFRDAEAWPVVVTRDGGLRLLSIQFESGPELVGNHAWVELAATSLQFASNVPGSA